MLQVLLQVHGRFSELLLALRCVHRAHLAGNVPDVLGYQRELTGVQHVDNPVGK